MSEDERLARLLYAENARLAKDQYGAELPPWESAFTKTRDCFFGLARLVIADRERCDPPNAVVLGGEG